MWTTQLCLNQPTTSKLRYNKGRATIQQINILFSYFLESKNFKRKIVTISYPSILIFVLGAQKNHLIEMVLLSPIEIFLWSTIEMVL